MYYQNIKAEVVRGERSNQSSRICARRNTLSGLSSCLTFFPLGSHETYLALTHNTSLFIIQVLTEHLIMCLTGSRSRGNRGEQGKVPVPVESMFICFSFQSHGHFTFRNSLCYSGAILQVHGVHVAASAIFWHQESLQDCPWAICLEGSSRHFLFLDHSTSTGVTQGPSALSLTRTPAIDLSSFSIHPSH